MSTQEPAMDWKALSAMLAEAAQHLAIARESLYWTKRSKANIRERLQRAKERIDNALQALQE